MEQLESTGFGDRLRRARIARGWTQDELAECAGLSVQAIGALERGTRQTPQRDTVRLLVAALELDEQERADFESLACEAGRAAAFGRRSRVRTLPPSPPPPAADVTLVEEPVASGSPLERAAPLTTGVEHTAPPGGRPESEFDASPWAVPVREGGVAEEVSPAVAVSSHWRVRRISLSGKRLRIAAAAGLVLVAILAVLLVFTGQIPRQLHVATVYRFDPSWSKPPPGPGPYLRPAGVAVDRRGNIYVSDAGNDRIQKLSPAGSLLQSWGVEEQGPASSACRGSSR